MTGLPSVRVPMSRESRWHEAQEATRGAPAGVAFTVTNAPARFPRALRYVLEGVGALSLIAIALAAAACIGAA